MSENELSLCFDTLTHSLTDSLFLFRSQRVIFVVFHPLFFSLAKRPLSLSLFTLETTLPPPSLPPSLFFVACVVDSQFKVRQPNKEIYQSLIPTSMCCILFLSFVNLNSLFAVLMIAITILYFAVAVTDIALLITTVLGGNAGVRLTSVYQYNRMRKHQTENREKAIRRVIFLHGFSCA